MPHYNSGFSRDIEVTTPCFGMSCDTVTRCPKVPFCCPFQGHLTVGGLRRSVCVCVRRNAIHFWQPFHLNSNTPRCLGVQAIPGFPAQGFAGRVVYVAMPIRGMIEPIIFNPHDEVTRILSA